MALRNTSAHDGSRQTQAHMVVAGKLTLWTSSICNCINYQWRISEEERLKGLLNWCSKLIWPEAGYPGSFKVGRPRLINSRLIGRADLRNSLCFIYIIVGLHSLFCYEYDPCSSLAMETLSRNAAK